MKNIDDHGALKVQKHFINFGFTLNLAIKEKNFEVSLKFNQKMF
jgi:hypothetical protein